MQGYAQSSSSSIFDNVWEEKSFKGFQDYCHCGRLGYRNEAIIATMNLHVASIHVPPRKIQYNLAFILEEEIICIVTKLTQWWPFRIFELNDLALIIN